MSYFETEALKMLELERRTTENLRGLIKIKDEQIKQLQEKDNTELLQSYRETVFNLNDRIHDQQQTIVKIGEGTVLLEEDLEAQRKENQQLKDFVGQEEINDYMQYIIQFKNKGEKQ